MSRAAYAFRIGLVAVIASLFVLGALYPEARNQTLSISYRFLKLLATVFAR